QNSANSNMLELTTTNVSVLRNMTLNNNTISNVSTITATGNITTSGNIGSTSGNVSGRNGSFEYLAVTGGTTKPYIPTSSGIYMGMDAGTPSTACGIEICASSLQYIDFTSPGVDFKGRIIYGWSNDFQFQINSSGTAKMTLNSTGLSVSGTVSTTSDKRFKFNENH
ncbi:MAG: hypothetical protein ACKPKO_07160, partial [Candidatus Fonsibacter sp.]